MTIPNDLKLPPAEDPIEMVHCASINLDNLAKMVPFLREHPMWMLARAQLTSAIEGFEREAK